MDEKMQAEPIDLFKSWLSEAEVSENDIPNAMALATCDAKGGVSVRMILLKEIWEGKFVFYTNLESPKAQQILSHQNVSLCFHWKIVRRQVRIDGPAALVPDSRADAYFQTRPRESQLGAWASKQSQVLASEEELQERLKHFEEIYEGQEIPRPPHWSGFAVEPKKFEFWEEKPFRLHKRRVYIKTQSKTWKTKLLYP